MTTTTSANMGAMITPPPPPGAIAPPPAPAKTVDAVLADEEHVLLVSNRNNVGGETRISSVKVDGGRLFVYEYVEQMNRSGRVSRVVAASALAFALDDKGKEKTVMLELVKTIPAGLKDETRISQLTLDNGRLFVYEQVAEIEADGIARRTVRNASISYVPNAVAQKPVASKPVAPQALPAVVESVGTPVDEPPPGVTKPNRGRPPKMPSKS